MHVDKYPSQNITSNTTNNTRLTRLYKLTKASLRCNLTCCNRFEAMTVILQTLVKTFPSPRLCRAIRFVD